MKYKANPVEVGAVKIIGVGSITADSALHLALEDGTNFIATAPMLLRYVPITGDYVVTQADGYVYLNPREVFERKYTPVNTEGGAVMGSLETLDDVIEWIADQCGRFGSHDDAMCAKYECRQCWVSGVKGHIDRAVEIDRKLEGGNRWLTAKQV